MIINWHSWLDHDLNCLVIWGCDACDCYELQLKWHAYAREQLRQMGFKI